MSGGEARGRHPVEGGCGRSWTARRPAGAKSTDITVSYLGRHSVGPGGKELGHTGRVKARLREAERSSQACPSGAHHHGIKLMVHYWVLRGNLEKKNSLVSHPFHYTKCEAVVTVQENERQK